MCDCYQKTIAKRGIDTGIWYCDSLMMLQSRFYKIYKEKSFGSGLQVPISSSTLDSVNDFASKFHFYIGEHCDSFFYKRGK